ncbi:PTS fructose-like transporter subunit IIB [Priestia endophytica]|jgi:fructose-like PTS system EIIB component|uniref:PTS fructose transporter subunit IIB n=2 Tax=Priestia endophytica TaxID=135735 RepID=A0AAX1Q6Z8_9BACI|nr:PTS fructose-like transporter subunit IIB [Priestia endophytica]KAB2495163.1 PTS fructose-like transporter subunit IIB [Priestia endophytica]KYG26203.1 PTS fructose transporter subunit IIB [Priestia endophytica]MBG9813827.1 hypothetical protein [Priestia endophytica]MCM3537792.1 PTS fructose-like transporter subunit IIB [Priestia endophytica]RAS75203.1 PTS fructose transporter subunit IIB [Priestia endophytica]
MKIVAVTSCPTGVAHTYLAAEALEKAFKEGGHTISVETQGSVGIEGEIAQTDIEGADFVILTKDVSIKGEERFSGKQIVRVTAGNAIRKADLIVKKLEQKLQEQ